MCSALPGAVTVVSAVASPTLPTAATITWELLKDNGGSPILGFEVTCTNKANEKDFVGPLTFLGEGTTSTGNDGFKGLDSGKTYTCTVAAFNVLGLGLAGTSKSFTTMWVGCLYI